MSKTAIKTTTVTTTYAKDRCYRYPCDHAYRQQQHLVLGSGSVVHAVGAGGSESDGWYVGLLATDDEPWRVAVRFTSEPRDGWNIIESDGRYPENEDAQALMGAVDLARAIMQAVSYMAGAQS